MTKKMILPTDPKERKSIPFVTGLIDYFPLALAEVAKVSLAGQEQHSPGQPLAWNRETSKDHHDCVGRHLVDRGTIDTDNMRHSAKLAWRALAALQIELEEEQKEEESEIEKLRKELEIYKTSCLRDSKCPEEGYRTSSESIKPRFMFRG